MDIEKRFSNEKVELRSDKETQAHKITGYASVFYDGTKKTEYELWENYIERIMPSAFDNALKSDDVRALFNHNPNFLLSRTEAGTLQLSVDDKGLKYEIDIPDTQAGRDVKISLERGDLTGSSFAFIVDESVYREVGDLFIREIKSVKLYDVGPVTYPAYEGTEAQARNLENAKKLKADFIEKKQKNIRAKINQVNARVRAIKII